MPPLNKMTLAELRDYFDDLLSYGPQCPYMSKIYVTFELFRRLEEGDIKNV